MTNDSSGSIRLRDAFKRARRLSGMTQRDVCDETGIPLGTLRRWEQGVNGPDVGSLIELANLYGVTVGQLVGLTEGPAADLAEDEARLLELFRSCSPKGREYLLQVAEVTRGLLGDS